MNQKNVNVLEKVLQVLLYPEVEVVLNQNQRPVKPKVEIKNNFISHKNKIYLEKSNKSQSKSKSPSKSKSNTHSPSRSSQSRSNHQKIDTKNSSPNKYGYIKFFSFETFFRRFNNRRVSDNDIGNNTWDKERRGNYYMGRDKPYFKRREDNRFKPYKRHDDDSKSRSSSIYFTN